MLTTQKSPNLIACTAVAHLFIIVTWVIACVAQTPSTIADQFTTPERIEKSKWWPTSGKAPRTDYAGNAACQECHFAIVKSQAQHSMAKTSVPASKSGILHDHAGEVFRVEMYDYKIVPEANGAFSYTVTDSTVAVPSKVMSGPITWAFGAGKV